MVAPGEARNSRGNSADAGESAPGVGVDRRLPIWDWRMNGRGTRRGADASSSIIRQGPSSSSSLGGDEVDGTKGDSVKDATHHITRNKFDNATPRVPG